MLSKLLTKRSSKMRIGLSKFKSEIEIHSDVVNHSSKITNSDNIVKFYQYYDSYSKCFVENSKLNKQSAHCIVLELCENQSMDEFLRRRGRLTEVEARCYAAQLINALKHLKHLNVIHRDIKLGNLFLTKKMELKLGDFGLAVRIDSPGQRRKSVLGTPNYIAPEVLNSKVGHSYEADLWALGVVIYIMLIGRAPFETQDLETTYKRINNAEYTFPCHINLSESSKKFITEILVVDPK